MQVVAVREVRSAARRPATYWTRVAAGAIGALVLLSLGLAEGRTMFIGAVVLGFLLCLLEGVRQGSTAIVEERNDGTLGLLFLTRLTGAELLFGKFAALLFFGAHTLLAVGPVLAISMIMGGVSLGEFVRAAVGLAQSLIVAMGVGIVISARSQDSTRAMFGAFFVLIGGAVVLSLKFWPAAGWPGFLFNALNPFTPIWTISDIRYDHFRTEYLISLILTATLVPLALWRIGAGLAADFAFKEAAHNNALQAPPGHETPQSFTTATLESARRGAQWFKGNPIEWLTKRNLGMFGREAIPFVFAVFFGVALLMVQFWSFLLALGIFVIFGFLYSAGASLTLARARQSGEIELWLTTPLTIRDIIAGQLAVYRTTFFWPGLILLLCFLTSLYNNLIGPLILNNASFSVTTFGDTYNDPIYSILYVLASTLLSGAALLFALPYVAMWLALKTKTPAQAAIRTFLLMIICPLIIFFIPKFLIFAPLAAVASHSVRSILKNFATQQTR